MAKSKKDLEGWQLVFEEEKAGVDSPVRRSRRTAAATAAAVSSEPGISVRRDDDQLVLKQGDVVHFEDADGVPTLGLIRDIRLDTDQFLSIPVFLFVKAKDISKEVSTTVIDNEVFLTVYQEPIQLSSVLDKVKVVSKGEFDQVVVDISTLNDIFVCSRASNVEGTMLSSEFDFRDMLKMFRESQLEFMEYLKSQTVTAARKTPMLSPAKKRPLLDVIDVTGTNKKEKKDTIKSEDGDYLSDDSDSSSSSVIEPESESDNDDDDNDLLDSEEEKKKKPKRRTAKVPAVKKERKSPIKSSPKRGRKPLLPKKPASTTGFKPKIKLSPLKSSFRSPSRPRIPKPETLEFKEIREKLRAGSERLRNLPAREDEYFHIFHWLSSSVEEQQGECFYISGTPGVGKTATVRAVIADMLDMASQNDITPFDYLEINGLKLISPNNAYEILWEKISGKKVTSNAALLALEKHFKDREEEGNHSHARPLIVLIDELDQIVTKKQNILYNFFNWPSYKFSKLVVIAIGNTMDLPERVLSNKISSRLGEKRYQFVGYTYEQLVQIVQKRLDDIKKNDKKVQINDTAIVLAARKVASVSGDARRALNICRRAVEIAEKEYTDNKEEQIGTYEVAFKHITKAVLETVNSPTAQFLRSLSFASKLTLVAMLNQINRKQKAENALGDVIDEMKIAILRLVSPHEEEHHHATSIYDLLYSSGLLDKSTSTANRIRVKNFNYIVTELRENGIINEQPIQSERYRTVNLNVSHEEVLSVLREDTVIYSLVYEAR